MSSFHTSSSVSLKIADSVATVTIAREHGNAINDDVLIGLDEAFRCAREDPTVRGLLLRGKGKIFCPGLDLQEMIELERYEVAGFMQRFTACMTGLYRFDKPVVAAISGHALAGGCLLALTADCRVLQRGKMMGLNEARAGLPIPFGMSNLLRDVVPPARIEEVALLGRNYRNQDAVDVGFAHEICDEADFEQVCRERLKEMADKEMAAFAATKRYIRWRTVERIERWDPVFAEEFLDCWFSDGTRERMQALVGKLKERSR